MLWIDVTAIVLREYEPAVFFVLSSEAQNIGTPLTGMYYQFVGQSLFGSDRPTLLELLHLDRSPCTPPIRIFAP